MKYLIFTIFILSMKEIHGFPAPHEESESEWLPRKESSEEPEIVTLRPTSWSLFPKTDIDSEFVPELLKPEVKPADFDQKVKWSSSTDWVKTDLSWIQTMYERLNGSKNSKNSTPTSVEDFGVGVSNEGENENEGNSKIPGSETEQKEWLDNEVLVQIESRRKKPGKKSLKLEKSYN